MKLFKYGNGGGIKRVINRENNSSSGYYDSLSKLLTELTHGTPYAMSGFRVKYYEFDDRLDKEVYTVTHDIEEFKQQFVCYFIEEDI